MRHARQISDHRLAADVLAERERQRRLELVVGLRLDDLAKSDDLANLVRDLEPNVRLAGDDLDDAHADRRERAGQVLREIADLAALHAGGRLELESSNDRSRVHGDDFRLDPEIVELELDQARHRLERVRRVSALLRRRIVEQRRAAAIRSMPAARTTALASRARALRSPRPSRVWARCAARWPWASRALCSRALGAVAWRDGPRARSARG